MTPQYVTMCFSEHMDIISTFRTLINSKVIPLIDSSAGCEMLKNKSLYSCLVFLLIAVHLVYYEKFLNRCLPTCLQVNLQGKSINVNTVAVPRIRTSATRAIHALSLSLLMLVAGCCAENEPPSKLFLLHRWSLSIDRLYRGTLKKLCSIPCLHAHQHIWEKS